MKKLISVLLAALLLLSVAAFAEGDYRVAMITDYGDITDQSFNQTTYEACKAYCAENGLDFTYYKPNGDSTAERVAMVEKADDEGYNVIVMPGYAFGETIAEVQDEYPDTCFIALDVSEGDLGGMAVPAVVRYGFGFVQGVNAAAEELGITGDVTVEYVYGNQFFGDADITAYMDNWYQTLGVQVVFACGGGIYSSAAEAAAKVNGGKVIGVDVDQAGIIDGTYGKGLTVTSAMKGLGATVNTLLAETVAGNFANYGGKVEALGLVGTDPAANYVQLAPSTQFADGFTEADYNDLVAKMFNGEITVSDAIDAMPATTVTVNDLGTVK